MKGYQAMAFYFDKILINIFKNGEQTEGWMNKYVLMTVIVLTFFKVDEN